jgi:hypothetical protein
VGAVVFFTNDDILQTVIGCRFVYIHNDFCLFLQSIRTTIVITFAIGPVSDLSGFDRKDSHVLIILSALVAVKPGAVAWENAFAGLGYNLFNCSNLYVDIFW